MYVHVENTCVCKYIVLPVAVNLNLSIEENVVKELITFAFQEQK
jgi:hypothetical protein